MQLPIQTTSTLTIRDNIHILYINNSRRLVMSRLAGVQPDSRENTSQLILLWAFPSRQGTVAPLKNKFTFCYPMTLGTGIKDDIAMGYSLDGWVSILGRSNRFLCSPQRPARLWYPHSLLSNGCRRLCPGGVKRPSHEANRSI
jgi:hypothetical protein